MGIAVALGVAGWVAFRVWRTPVRDPIEVGISDSAQVEKMLYRLGLVNVDLSQCVETETIDGKVRIVSFYLDGRELPPGFHREWTLSERLGKRHVVLTGISNLSELRFLKLVNVAVFELPEEIGRLKKLEYLQIANGRLTSLPDSLGQASALAFLYFPTNRISALPASVCTLDGVKALMVAGNPGIRFPPGRCLENLGTLYIDRSQVDLLPKHLPNRIEYTTVKAD